MQLDPTELCLKGALGLTGLSPAIGLIPSHGIITRTAAVLIRFTAPSGRTFFYIIYSVLQAILHLLNFFSVCCSIT